MTEPSSLVMAMTEERGVVAPPLGKWLSPAILARMLYPDE